MKPLGKAEQDEIFRQADEMGRRMALGMAGLVASTNPGVDADSVFKGLDEKFRANLNMVMEMSPEEYARHKAHREEEEHKERLQRDLEKAKRKLHEARWTLRHAKDAARKAGIL